MNKNLMLVGVIAVALLAVIGYQSLTVSGKPVAYDAMTKDVMVTPGVAKDMRPEMASSSAMDMMKEEIPDASISPSNGETMMEDAPMMMKEGSYIPYDAAKLEMAKTGNVVLFFRASWCPTCRNLDADIRAHLTGIPANLTILDVDYDNSSELKKKYGVTYQHTFVQVDASGAMMKKWSGSPTLAALVSELK